MGLSKLGSFIELVDARNTDGRFSAGDLRGISISKVFTPTKADANGLNLKSYKIVEHGHFAYSTVTSRNGNKISIAYNDGDPCIVSAINPVFRVKDETKLLPRYLMMFFNRPEFDRYARFNSWGSAREIFSWEDFCSTELDIPPLSLQQKYVAIYEAMMNNLKAYESGLDDMRLVCNGMIDSFKKTCSFIRLGDFITRTSEKNTSSEITKVLGLSTSKQWREPNSRVNTTELKNYRIVRRKDFAFVPTTDTWKVLAFAYNDFDQDIVVSPIYETFRLNVGAILPEYLSLFLARKEFDRYARFNSWGSARENFTFDDMSEVRLPLPDMKTQRAIASLFKAIAYRTKILQQMKERISAICPLLIRGSIEEASCL